MAAVAGAMAAMLDTDIAEAVAVATTFDILGLNSPLSRRLDLLKEDDWIDFMNQSGSVKHSGGDGQQISIDLEKLLRHCFDIAFKMPPSHTKAASDCVGVVHPLSCDA